MDDMANPHLLYGVFVDLQQILLHVRDADLGTAHHVTTTSTLRRVFAALVNGTGLSQRLQGLDRNMSALSPGTCGDDEGGLESAAVDSTSSNIRPCTTQRPCWTYTRARTRACVA